MRKGVAYQDRKFLENNLSTAANHHRKKLWPHPNPFHLRLNGEPGLPPSSGHNSVPELTPIQSLRLSISLSRELGLLTLLSGNETHHLWWQRSYGETESPALSSSNEEPYTLPFLCQWKSTGEGEKSRAEKVHKEIMMKTSQIWKETWTERLQKVGESQEVHKIHYSQNTEN